MAISDIKAKTVTGLYSMVRRTGFLNSNLGKACFARAYFSYKRHFEDPFFALTNCYPELFAGGHVLDVGANIGYTASVFADAVQPGYKVYAFEPELFNFQLLQKAAATHPSRGIVPVHSAVGDRVGSIQLLLNKNHHADHRVVVANPQFQDQTSVISVPITTLDFFCELQKVDTIAFIKIDVQGYELPVCLGMEQTLLNNPQAVVALEYSPQDMQKLGMDGAELLSWYSQRNYQVYSLAQDGSLTAEGELDEKSGSYTDLLFSRRPLIT
jgi:FkbM family methyltransferase